jgi:hypothetical protein
MNLIGECMDNYTSTWKNGESGEGTAACLCNVNPVNGIDIADATAT